MNAQWPALREHTLTHLTSSNHCEWLNHLMWSDALSTGRISPAYFVRVYYDETKSTTTTITKDFVAGPDLIFDLRRCLARKHIRAVVLCHRDSSQVDPEVLDLLWGILHLEVSFLRQHLDYKSFRVEKGCPEAIRERLLEEEDTIEDSWTFGGRWNPIRLPSETRASNLRLAVDSECLSVCCKDDLGT